MKTRGGVTADKLKLPEFVRVCPLCKGEGKTEQTYTAGCGMGSYRSMGACEYCKGWRFLSGDKPITSSILNQINVANELQLSCNEWGYD